MEVTYNSEELIKSEEKYFLIQNKEQMKFCQIFLQTRFAGLSRNLDSQLLGVKVISFLLDSQLRRLVCYAVGLSRIKKIVNLFGWLRHGMLICNQKPE